MGFKSLLSKPFAKWVLRGVRKNAANAIACQDNQFNQLIAKARSTAFGRDHDFASIQSEADFRKRVPIAD